MSADLINTLLLFGASQGLFLALLLGTKQTNSAANRVLAAAMLAFSVYLLQGVYYARAYYLVWPHFIGVSVPLTFAFGPVLYLYAQAVSTGGHTLSRASLLHFVPAALVALYLSPFYLQEGAAKVVFLEALIREGPPFDVAVIQHLQYPHGIAYVVLTAVLLRRHRARLRETHAFTERVNLLWLRNLTIGVVIVWGLATGLHLLETAGLGLDGLESRLTPLAVSVLVYAIGYLGLRQPEIFHLPIRHRPIRPAEPRDLPPGRADAEARPEATSDTPPRREPHSPVDRSTGYEKSGLTEARAEACMRALRRLMEEQQHFKQNQLTLQDLADELSISAHNLSEVINSQSGKNFYDFVNGYRAEEVMRRLRDPQSDHLTILAIAEESGFNAKSTFNAFFKKHTGLTPSQYRARHRTRA